MITKTKRRKEATMLDLTIGPVINIIDGNTFTISVTHIGNHNKFTYRDFETVRDINISTTSLSTIQGQSAKRKLLSRLNGKKVRCKIHHRDQYSVLIAEVEIL